MNAPEYNEREKVLLEAAHLIDGLLRRALMEPVQTPEMRAYVEGLIASMQAVSDAARERIRNEREL